MEILVLVKPAPDPETRLRPNAAGTAFDTDGIRWTLAGYDESAVEQALLLKESVPGSHTRVLSFSRSGAAEEVLRAALALGCDQATWCEQPADLAVDPVLSARALAVACRKYRFDLVLVGKQAADDEASVVGPAVAEFLGIADYGAVVDLRWDDGSARFRFGRAVEGGTERLEAPAPCVIGLQQAWNDPRTAKLQNILKSRRIPIDKLPWPEISAALGDGRALSRPSSFRLPPPRTGAKMIEYQSPEEAAQKLVALLRNEAKALP